MIGCGGYLGDLVVIYLSPSITSGLSADFATVAGLAELVFLLWLVIRGAAQRCPPRHHQTAPGRGR
jgi:hypothetical protein